MPGFMKTVLKKLHPTYVFFFFLFRSRYYQQSRRYFKNARLFYLHSLIFLLLLAWSDLKAVKSNLVQRIDMFFINPVIYLFSNYYS